MISYSHIKDIMAIEFYKELSPYWLSADFWKVITLEEAKKICWNYCLELFDIFNILTDTRYDEIFKIQETNSRDEMIEAKKNFLYSEFDDQFSRIYSTDRIYYHNDEISVDVLLVAVPSDEDALEDILYVDSDDDFDDSDSWTSRCLLVNNVWNTVLKQVEEIFEIEIDSVVEYTASGFRKKSRYSALTNVILMSLCNAVTTWNPNIGCISESFSNVVIKKETDVYFSAFEIVEDDVYSITYDDEDDWDDSW